MVYSAKLLVGLLEPVVRAVQLAPAAMDRGQVLQRLLEPIRITRHVRRSRIDSPAKLAPVLRQVLEGRQEKEVLLEADRDVAYGEVVKVMAAIREAGVQKLGMVAEQPEK